MAYLLKDDEDTLRFGQLLAQYVPARALVYLNGPLGAGKTTLVRGFLRACGHSGSTKSPTYTLVEPYQLKDRQVYHFDLYRLGDPEELEYIGIRDYLEEAAIFLVEWPERGTGYIPSADLSLNLNYHAESRRITLEHDQLEWAAELAKKLEKTFEVLP